MRWLGTALQIVGALAMASNEINPYWAYAIMLPGALILAVAYGARRDWQIMSLQTVFVAINFLGIWRWGAGA